jgi:transposase InsO family protein
MMRDNAIRARSKRKYKATTDSNHGLPVSDNVLNRDFQPERPDLVWTGDITYIATREGWLYLAVVIDLFSRQVVGWAMGKRMTRHLVIDALTMAWFRRRPAEGLIFHSDQGSQYASGEFQATLRGYAMRGSMSRKGNCWDNAVTETLFGSLKVERLHDMHFETRRQAQDEVIDWLADPPSREARRADRAPSPALTVRLDTFSSPGALVATSQDFWLSSNAANRMLSSDRAVVGAGWGNRCRSASMRCCVATAFYGAGCPTPS